MKVLKVISRICFVLALIALIVSFFFPSGYIPNSEGYYIAIYATVDSIIVVCMAVGVVSEFTDEANVFKKVGLALLLAGAIGIAGTAFTTFNYGSIASFALVVLGLLFEFICFLLARGEGGDASNLETKIERLQKLHTLLEQKIITEDEYNEMRVKILGLPKKKK